MSRESVAQLVETKDGGSSPHAHTQSSGKTKACSGCLIEWGQTQQVGTKDSHEQGGGPGSDACTLVVCCQEGREQARVHRGVGLLKGSLAAPETPHAKEGGGGDCSRLDLGGCVEGRGEGTKSTNFPVLFLFRRLTTYLLCTVDTRHREKTKMSAKTRKETSADDQYKPVMHRSSQFKS